MDKRVITFIIMFVVLVLVQALLMNHIVLFNYAVCFVFIYFLIKLPVGISSNWLLTLGFFLGLTVDLLSDTPGLNALSCTLLASLKRPVFYAYMQHDDHTRNIEPGVNTMGWLNYGKYMLTMSAIYSFIITFVEYLSFADILEILIKAAASAIFTFLIIFAVDSMAGKNQ